MKKSEIRFYTEADSADVVQMLIKNKFYVAKNDRKLTEERFVDIQRKRGMLFAVVAKKGDDVVAFFAVYRTGCQRVAKKNEVFVSSFLVDKKYRTSFFVMFDMFAFAVKEILIRGYTIISSEATYSNDISLHVLRKIGFTLLNNEHDIYNHVVLHNYVFGLMKMTNFDESLNEKTMPNILPHFSKKDLLSPNDRLGLLGVWQTYNLKCGLTDVLFHINEGFAIGAKVREKFEFYPSDLVEGYYIIKNLSRSVGSVTISSTSDNTSFEIEMEAFSSKMILIENDNVNMRVHIDDFDETFNFYIVNVNEIKSDYSSFPLNSTMDFDFHTGVFKVKKTDKTFKIRELWPSLSEPYLMGSLVPNLLYPKSVETISDHELLVTVDMEDIKICRKYTYSEESVEIETYYNNKNQVKIEPFYQISIDDLDYVAKLYTKNVCVHEDKYHVCDGSYNIEVMFENFKKYNMDIENVDKVCVEYDDIKYSIKFPPQTKMFINCNCIIGRQTYIESGNMSSDGMQYLGKITIDILK